MSATVKPKGLHAKLAEVMSEAGRIPKNGKAPAAMGGFEFVQVGDAADVIRKALGDRGVSMLPTAVEIVGEAEHQTRNGGTMTTQTVRTTWTLVDGETGETAVIQSLGTGADSGDKFSPKAQTNAMKYALLMGFLLSTGDDPEQTDTSDRGERRQPTPRTPGAPSTGRGAPPAADSSGGGGEPVLVPLGIETHIGKVTRGDGGSNDVEYHAGPNGHALGFRLDLGEGKAIPQVICEPPIGEALYLTTPVGELLGQQVRVTGEAYRVETPGRRAFRRLVVVEMSGPFGIVPAPDGDPDPEPAPPSAADKVNDLDQLPF